MRIKGLPDPAAPRTEVPTWFLASARSFSSGGGGVSRPPGVVLQPRQAGVPLLSRRVGNARSPLQPRRRWSNLGCPLAAPPDGAMVRPTGLVVLTHRPSSGCDVRSESRAVLSREGSGEVPAVAPPSAARAPPLWGGVRRSAARLRCNGESWAAGLLASKSGAFAYPPSPKAPIINPDPPSRTS